jgi:hypothetical protein
VSDDVYGTVASIFSTAASNMGGTPAYMQQQQQQQQAAPPRSAAAGAALPPAGRAAVLAESLSAAQLLVDDETSQEAFNSCLRVLQQLTGGAAACSAATLPPVWHGATPTAELQRAQLQQQQQQQQQWHPPQLPAAGAAEPPDAWQQQMQHQSGDSFVSASEGCITSAAGMAADGGGDAPRTPAGSGHDGTWLQSAGTALRLPPDAVVTEGVSITAGFGMGTAAGGGSRHQGTLCDVARRGSSSQQAAGWRHGAAAAAYSGGPAALGEPQAVAIGPAEAVPPPASVSGSGASVADAPVSGALTVRELLQLLGSALQALGPTEPDALASLSVASLLSAGMQAQAPAGGGGSSSGAASSAQL